MDKFKIGDIINYGFMKELKVVDITAKYYVLQDKNGNIEEKFKDLVEKHGELIKSKLLNTKTSIIYCAKLKNKNEYIDERYNLTKDVFEAIGWKTKELCQKDINELDNPNDYIIVKKTTTVKMELL